ncbi:uncharacterized protein LOC114455366 isoform X2 [Gouania willdenowi]|uniref:uncharacterized protein LOC114455366 isoform X2 n=1 Tax=Gouania willdenowi TaxID=441366 RepID=UPI0010559BE3|nr:uncharacterized protein LOC114455366 isoform X2 [Gouania willdenowi]
MSVTELGNDGEQPKLTSNESRCIFFNTDSEDYHCVVILAVRRATGTFSLIGCLFMLFVIWLLRRYHSLAQKMILSLTVAALFDSVAYVMGESHPQGSLCSFQAWWLTYFDWSALVWVCLITLNLYLNLVREISTIRYEMLYHLMAWGVPLVMASLPLLKGYYGPAGPWCWITADHVAWRFGMKHKRLTLLSRPLMCFRTKAVEQMVRASFQPHYPDDVLLWQDHLCGQSADTVVVGNLQPRTGETKGFLGRGDQAIEVVSICISAGFHLSSHQQLALQSRLCDRTRIGEYHPGAVRYTQADLVDHSDDDDDDTNVLFYSPDMTLKDRGP